MTMAASRNGTNATVMGLECPVSLAHQDLPALLPFLAALQTIILVGSLVGNLVVFIVFCKKQSLLTPSNRLILNLALTNFAMAVVVMPAVIVSFIADRWLFGELWCHIVGLLTSVLFSACIFTLVLISLDRYCAIVTPLHYTSRVTRVRTYTALAIVWAVSVCISSPPLFGWSHFTYQEEKHTCTVNWKTSDRGEKVYTLILTIVCFCAPFVLMIWVYVTLFHVAKSNQERTRRRTSLTQETHCDPQRSLNGRAANGRPKKPSLISAANSLGQVFRMEEWKAAKTSLVIVFAFSLCWIPYFAVITLNSLYQKPECIPWWVESLSVVLMLLDCMLNPIVYVFRNKAMRSEITRMVCRARPNFDVENGRKMSSESRENLENSLRVMRASRRCNSEPAAMGEPIRNGVIRNGSGLSSKTGSLPDEAESSIYRFLGKESQVAMSGGAKIVTFGDVNDGGLNLSTMTSDTFLPGEVGVNQAV